MNIKKVGVGMSGGVDSSVAALLLKQAGYDVVGITLLLKPTFTKEDEDSLYKEVNDAKMVCETLGIKHYTPDFRAEFRENVIDNFVDEYKNGRTPNPCIKCNSFMKFGKMLDFALEIGCDYISTGHYAVTEEKDGQFFLKRSDSPKDQSYFLYNLNQYQLSHTLFPLVGMEKSEIRAIAEKNNLPVAHKSDSQDICFVKGNDYIHFLENRMNAKVPEGDFIDENGKVLGKHKGIYCYTVGQRRGLGIALGERCFVRDIDAVNNTVCISKGAEQKPKKFVVEKPHFINFDKLTEKREVLAKTRYRAKPEKATIQPFGDDVLLEFLDYECFASPGQSAVFYDNDIVLGGGIIKKG